MVARRVIKPVIPLCFIGTVFVFTWILGEDPVFQILSGGLMLGAIFMATDYTTSPLSTKGRIVFGIGCGIIYRADPGIRRAAGGRFVLDYPDEHIGSPHIEKP